MVKALAIALESIGICAIIGGIIFEAQVQAPTGFIIITVGSALIAFGGMLWAKILKR